MLLCLVDDDPYIGYISGDSVYYDGGRFVEEVPEALKRNPASMGWLMSAAMKICHVNPNHCMDGRPITDEPKFFTSNHRKRIASQRSPFEFF